MIYAQQVGASTAACNAVAHAVSEALTNAVVHGYDEQEPGELTLEAWHDSTGHLYVRVSDEGTGMVPRPDRPGLGLGLNLMAELAEDVRFRDDRQRPGTTVSMRFDLEASETSVSQRDPSSLVPAPFEIHERSAEGQRVMFPLGELDLVGAEELERRLAELGSSSPSTMIDLSGISFIDSSGITALVRAKQWADRSGRKLEMRNPSVPVQRVLELTRVNELLGIPPQEG